MFNDSRFFVSMALAAIVLGDVRAAEPAAAPVPSAPADPVFDCYAANSAWGLMYAGKMIDRNGDIWAYSERGKSLPAASQVQGITYFTQAALQAKYAQAKKSGSVDAKALAEKTALIEKASAGKITRTDAGVRDAGSSACHAYVFDAAGQRYRDVELGSDGHVSDMRTTNDAGEAQDLLTWLKSVGVAI